MPRRQILRRCGAACLALLPATAIPAADPGLDALAGTVATAAIRGDVTALNGARERLRGLLEDPDVTGEPAQAARAHFWLAFASWQIVLTSFGNTSDYAALASDASTHSLAAAETDPAFVDGQLLAGMVQASSLPPKQAVEAAAPFLARARALAPDDPHIAFADGFARMFTPEGGAPAFELAAGGLAAKRDVSASMRDWWQPMAHAFLADIYLGSFGQPADLERARTALARALELAPDMLYAREVVAPRLAPRQAAPLDRVTPGSWTLLGEDPSADGRAADLPDATALAMRHDTDEHVIWFRVDLERPLPSPAFGINLALSTGEEASDGMNWWGANREFVFDRMVTVWVARDAEGRFVGTVGLGDAHGTRTRRPINLPADVRFALGPDRRSIFAGVACSDLGRSRSLDVLAAVGSMSVWNDDLPVVRLDLAALHAASEKASRAYSGSEQLADRSCGRSQTGVPVSSGRSSPVLSRP